MAIQIGTIVWVGLLACLLVLFNDTPRILRYMHQPQDSPSNSMCPPYIEAARNDSSALSIVVFGASGDLATRKIFPTLFELYCQGSLPLHTQIVGYARSNLSRVDFEGRISKYFKCKDTTRQNEFLAACQYMQGDYTKRLNIDRLHEHLSSYQPNKIVNRLFYFAVSPSVFAPLAQQLREACMASEPRWTRVVVEKPFGRDLVTCSKLMDSLSVFSDDQVFKIDHYLGKAMVQNLLVLRFANSIFGSLWNNEHISNVVITFKEDIGLEGRGGYFDEYGIIRDIMQNHLIQILALIGIEPPQALETKYIQNKKLEFLKQIREVKLSDVAIGQFGSSSSGWVEKGYKEYDDIRKDSRTPTYAAAALFVDNERWRDVPFILRCGKGLDEKKVEICIQFKSMNSGIFREEQEMPNELVIRVQPDESISMRLVTKHPGFTEEIVTSELDLSYKTAFNVSIPDAYEKLILDVIEGDHSLFLQTEELKEAWRIFTPVLEQLESVDPEIYPFGSSGPENALQLVQKYGFKTIGKASR